ncbi:DUF3558 domain-containing protein [Amycolatopsis sp. NPDC005232]|uniref:DUF3558 domain-containing protein n=1 Tax=Amycolatopsis sp. NPDC005232 TaxID=3157027 RepID=UPI0033A0475D
MHRAGRVGTAVGVVATLCGLAACSGESGTATPAPSSASPSTGQQSGSPVPKVSNPLPASVIQRDPCTVLTQAQIDGLFSGTPTQGAVQDTGAAKSCSWSDLDKGSLVGIQLVYAWKDGLSSVYNTQGQGGFFKVLSPVQGYPVVAYGPHDERSQGRCSVAVGIADNAAFDVDVTLARSAVGQADPCEDANHVADLAVTTLKGGA